METQSFWFLFQALTTGLIGAIYKQQPILKNHIDLKEKKWHLMFEYIYFVLGIYHIKKRHYIKWIWHTKEENTNLKNKF